ncbi:MAG TPA: hypothetical protein PLK61_04025 [Nitrosomonas sp.]|nr:hypothetical protein [Nitrosomonas sp.]
MIFLSLKTEGRLSINFCGHAVRVGATILPVTGAWPGRVPEVIGKGGTGPRLVRTILMEGDKVNGLLIKLVLLQYSISEPSIVDSGEDRACSACAGIIRRVCLPD